MSYKTRRAGLLACAVVLAACKKTPPPAFARLALTPFENLSADAGLDWVSRAVPAVLAAQLAGSPGMQAWRVESLRDTQAARATRNAHGYFTAADGQLTLTVFLEDTAANKTLGVLTARGAQAAGILPLADALARRLATTVRPFSTANPAAFAAYAEGLRATSPDAALAAYRQAIAADADFGGAYVAAAQTLAVRGDRPAMRDLVAAARQRRIPEIEQAQLALVAASLDGDTAARAGALGKLSVLLAADTDVIAQAAEALVLARQFPAAIDAYQRLLRLTTPSAATLNSLGYAHAFARDLESARRSIEQYGQLEPDNANPLDSLGEVHFYLGRFAEAEQYFMRAYEKNKAFFAGGPLFKAARARLMTGDVAGADALFEKYLVAHAAGKDDPLAGLQKAKWEYVSGRRPAALARLEKIAPGLKGDARSQALAQLSIWLNEGGNDARAAASAREALALSTTPATRALAAICVFTTQPRATAVEWSARAARAFPDPRQRPLRDVTLGYALLLGRHFAEAVPVWQGIMRESHPANDGHARVMLAWALVESGRAKEAEPLVSVYPIPPNNGDSPFVGFELPRLLNLRRLPQRLNSPAAAPRRHGAIDAVLADRDL